MNTPAHLLQMMLAIFAMNGISPEVADPWDTWRSFKQFARTVHEVPDPGVSVQRVEPGAAESKLMLVRQIVEGEGKWLRPIGGAVCEVGFSDEDRGDEWEIWSLDFPSFERFVDAVEQHPEFARLMTRLPAGGAVYWLNS